MAVQRHETVFWAMSTPRCPRCDQVIPGDDVNVAKDVAYCRQCNIVQKLSGLLRGAGLHAGVDFTRPPPGVRQDADGRAFVITATHRSIGTAIGTLAAALFWNGIVSVFVLLAIAGTLNNLHVPVPHWFPAPNMNDSPMGWGMTIFLWIFLTPFIAIGTFLFGTFVMCLSGRTEVRIDRNDGMVFTGVGPLGYRRRFDVSTVKDVRIEDALSRDSDGDSQRNVRIVIETHAGRLIKFGSMLSDGRRKFVAAVVYKALMKQPTHSNGRT